MIMLHGFGGARGEVVGAAPLFWDRGCDLLMYDSRGHGDSSPALLTFGPHEKDDLVAAIAWLSRRTKLPDGRIGLIGWSYGAAVSIQAAAKVPDIAFVVADSSYSSLEDIARVQADNQFGAWAKVFVPGALFIAGKRAEFDPGTREPGQRRSPHVKAPVLLIHSRQDGFTPYQHSEKIYAASDKRADAPRDPVLAGAARRVVPQGPGRVHEDRRPLHRRVQAPGRAAQGRLTPPRGTARDPGLPGIAKRP